MQGLHSKCLALLAVLALLSGPAVAQKTPAAIQSEVNSQIVANGTGAITGPILNGILIDIAKSYGGTLATNTWTLAQTFNQPVATGLAGTATGSLTLSGTTSGSTILGGTATGGHLTYAGSGTAPTLTAGCNGGGSSISGTDISGTAGNQTAAATSCTITFGTAFSATPRCVVSGRNTPVTSYTPSTSTLVLNFASTANAVFDWACYGS